MIYTLQQLKILKVCALLPAGLNNRYIQVGYTKHIINREVGVKNAISSKCRLPMLIMFMIASK